MSFVQATLQSFFCIFTIYFYVYIGVTQRDNEIYVKVSSERNQQQQQAKLAR